MTPAYSRATILIVDDSPTNIEVLSKVLEADYEVLFAMDGAHAVALALAEMPDLILLDVMMPHLDGYDVCRLLRDHPSTSTIPVVFVTGLDDEAAESRGLELGAVDYLTKPFNATIVRARVRNQIALKQTRDELRRLSVTDGLTQVANRSHFDGVLEMECRRLARSGGRLGLIMIDIDYFKLFNDTYGHLAGDDCLRRVATVLGTSTRRGSDLTARYGGEEFACILPDTDETGTRVVAERMQAGVAALGISHGASLVAPVVTLSIGLANVLCRPGTSGVDIVALADTALYRAKEGGRNRIAGAPSLPLSVGTSVQRFS